MHLNITELVYLPMYTYYTGIWMSYICYKWP